MRILIIHNRYLESGGEDKVVSCEIEMLKKHGHKVVLYARSNEEIKSYGLLKKVKFLFSGIAWSKNSFYDIKNLIAKTNPDLAHIHNIFIAITPSVYFALKEAGIPIVQTMHNFRFFCSNGLLYRDGRICEDCINGNPISSLLHRCYRGSVLLSFLIKRMLEFHSKKQTFQKNIDAYIALSEFSRNKFIKAGLQEEKIYIKSNFVSDEFGPMEKIGDYALFAGRLVNYKGIDTLISAYKKLTGCRLKIIGDGPDLDKLKLKVKDMSNVALLGGLPYKSAIEYIKNASFIIFPSRCYENMPRVVIESFACGVPVIASNIGVIPEIVKDKVNGLLFNPGDSEDLASKVKFLLERKDLLLSMKSNARKTYEKKYTPEINYASLMNIYKNVWKSFPQKNQSAGKR